MEHEDACTVNRSTHQPDHSSTHLSSDIFSDLKILKQRAVMSNVGELNRFDDQQISFSSSPIPPSCQSHKGYKTQVVAGTVNIMLLTVTRTKHAKDGASVILLMFTDDRSSICSFRQKFNCHSMMSICHSKCHTKT